MRRVTLKAAGCAASLAVLTSAVVLGGASPAGAAGGGRDDQGDPPGASSEGGGSYEVHATQRITIEGGSSDGTVLTGTYSAPPPCFYRPGSTGPEMWDNSNDPLLNRLMDIEGVPEDERWPDDLAQRRTDVDGRYWYPICSSAYFSGPLDEFFDYVTQYFADNDTVWVPNNQDPPNPPVPPSILRHIAREYADVPVPVAAHNPAAQAVVRLDTWVWLTDSTFEPVEVTARSGPNWATVTLTPDRLALSAPNATQVGSCASGGTPYDLARPAASQSTDCALLFSRSSAAQPGNTYEVSATTSWSASWAGSDGSGGALEGATETTTFDLEVAEVQAIVSGTR